MGHCHSVTVHGIQLRSGVGVAETGMSVWVWLEGYGLECEGEGTGCYGMEGLGWRLFLWCVRCLVISGRGAFWNYHK